ncbi:hypothetical protein HU230_0013300 [Bradyrhizobium quebecense]|uniref:SPOR domain-containing protein n=1 Tax=Bradyrhizobium quebecense TaxID=2748629 RepID=A0A974ACT5_9BRAD|nr:hypothetical protein [Bradyrhizobium quebecense]UGA46955.1 hypothetical protein HU230_0013300 [Bradyrhizobium quebecense]
MAKDPDNLAADFDTESTTGFLAEEDAFDRRMLWRLGSWGVAAVGAVTVAVMANQSALTLRRDQVAASDIARQAQQLQTLAKESHNETRRLASAIDTLNSDRDRLYSRVTTLEQGLDSVTGTIAKQPVAAVPAPPTPAASPATPPASANSAPAVAAPTVAAVATTPPAASDKPVATDKVVASIDSKAPAPAEKPVAAAEKPMAADKKPAAAASRPQVAAEKPSAPESLPPVSASAPAVASPMSAAAAAASTDEVKAAAPAATPAADKPLMASRDPAPSKATEAAKPPTSSDVNAAPIPPLMITRDPDSDVEDEAPKAQIQRTEFGVDLGTANSVNGLRALWRGLLKSKANAPLAALRPIIVIKENGNGLGMQLRLVAGPLNDAGTAARICAGLSLVQRTCETAIYDGQRLALNEPPAGAKPALPHRRAAPRRTVAPPQPVAEEKKPEPTTISSMFRRNSQ